MSSTLFLPRPGLPVRQTTTHASIGRVVEEVWPEAEHALDQIRLHHLAPHLPLLLTEQHAVREEDGATARLRLQARQDVLPKKA